MSLSISDPVTLDQLRAFLTVVQEGSFSAAARKLKRVQSAISTSMANLEAQLGVPIWDRRAKVPRLTSQGDAIVIAARRVLTEVDGLRRLTDGLARGQEAMVSLCVDALFPLGALIDLCGAFARAFPSVDLRVDTQLMSAVAVRVLSGAATLGVASPLGILPGLERKALSPVRLVAVVSPDHPLAAHAGPIPAAALADAIQIVLSERSDHGVDHGVADQAVLSPRTWRVADLHTKHAMLAAGLGWGNLPEHLVRDDLVRRRLVAIRPDVWGEAEHTLGLSAIWRPDLTIGPAHRWLIDHVETLCAEALAPPAPRPPARRGPRAKR